MRLLFLVFLLWLLSGPVLAQSVVLNWNEVTLDTEGNPEQIQGYDVAYGTQAGGPYQLGFSTSATQLRIDDLVNGERYYFVVRAIDQGGNTSTNSNQVEWLVPLEDCENLGDDDFDGLVDCEDSECPTLGDACPLQQGVCQGTYQPCAGAQGFLACDAQVYGDDYEETETRCDGLDNDCDGQVDSGLQADLCPLQLGVCAGTQLVCEGASGWIACDQSSYGADYEVAETRCDGLDNDCDGVADEDCRCSVGQVQACSSDQGECTQGQQECSSEGEWNPCDGTLPTDEVCDGLDNDCDGDSDEDLVGEACPLQNGVCAGLQKPCLGQAGWQDCDAQVYGSDYQLVELSCDGMDNDCDGLTDEECSQTDGGVPDAGQSDAGDLDQSEPPTNAKDVVVGGVGCSHSHHHSASSLFFVLFLWLLWIRTKDKKTRGVL